jgi:SAM-dependent methyltransferase
MEFQTAQHVMQKIGKLGPQPAMYPSVHEAIKVLWAKGVDESWVKTHIVDPSRKYITAHEEFGPMNLISLIYDQQYGYAGDWKLMDRIYKAYDNYAISWAYEGKLGRGHHASLWDSYILSLKTTWSLYCRERYLLHQIGMLIDSGEVKSILDIGCGNGRLLKQIRFIYPHVGCDGIDNEPTAIAAALQDSQQCRFIRMNAIEKLPGGHYDLVLSAGVCDYLDDKHFIRLLRRIEYYNTPGYVILGNLREHENQAEMELFRWKLIYRTSMELVTLGINHFLDKRFRVGIEQMKVNYFLHIEPKGD